MSTDTPAPLRQIPLSPSNRTALHWLVRDDSRRGDGDPFILDAPYQRGAVWTEDQQRNLVRSLLMGLPIGSVIVAHLGYSTEKAYRIIDGQQRIRAIRAWADGDLPVPGWWFDPRDLADPSYRDRDVTSTDLSDRGRRRYENWSVPAIEMDSTVEWVEKPEGGWDTVKRTPEQMLRAEAQVYLLVNFGGVEQTDDDRARAQAIAAAGPAGGAYADFITDTP